MLPLHNPPDFFFVAFPFIANACIKIISALLSEKVQRAELDGLIRDHQPPGANPLLSNDQAAVILAVLGQSTSSIIGGGTLLSSVIAFLLIVLKNPQGWLWWCWLGALVVAVGLWILIFTRKPYANKILRLPVGWFILLLSCALDAILIALSLAATRGWLGTHVPCP